VLSAFFALGPRSQASEATPSFGFGTLARHDLCAADAQRGAGRRFAAAAVDQDNFERKQPKNTAQA
jgi:hypothetical protein